MTIESSKIGFATREVRQTCVLSCLTVPLLLVVLVGVSASADEAAAQSEAALPEATASSMGSLPGCRWVHDEGMNTFRLLDLKKSSPAEAAGLQVGDVLVALNGEETRVTSVVQAISYFDGLVAGEEVELTVRRGQEELMIVMVAEEMPTEFRRRLESQRSTHLEQARRQDAMNWLKRSTLGGRVVIHVSRLVNNKLSVTATGAQQQPPEGLADWLLDSQMGAELKQLQPREWIDYVASMDANGSISFDRDSE